MSLVIPTLVKMGLVIRGIVNAGLVGDSSESSGCNFYYLDPAETDKISFDTPFTGTLGILFSTHNGDVGLNPVFAGTYSNAPVEAKTNPALYANTAHQVEVDVTDLTDIVDETFDGVVWGLRINGEIHYIDMGYVPPVLPKFTEHPKQLVMGSTDIRYFGSKAQDYDTLQWQESADGTNWVNSTWVGNTTEVLTVDNPTALYNGYLFRNTATNENGTTNSNSAELIVLAGFDPNNFYRFGTNPTDPEFVDLQEDITVPAGTGYVELEFLGEDFSWPDSDPTSWQMNFLHTASVDVPVADLNDGNGKVFLVVPEVATNVTLDDVPLNNGDAYPTDGAWHKLRWTPVAESVYGAIGTRGLQYRTLVGVRNVDINGSGIYPINEGWDFRPYIRDVVDNNYGIATNFLQEGWDVQEPLTGVMYANYTGARIDLPMPVESGVPITLVVRADLPIANNEILFDTPDNAVRAYIRQSDGKIVTLGTSQVLLDGRAISGGGTTTFPRDGLFHTLSLTPSIGSASSTVGNSPTMSAPFNGVIRNVRKAEGSEFFYPINDGNTGSVENIGSGANGTFNGSQAGNWIESVPLMLVPSFSGTRFADFTAFDFREDFTISVGVWFQNELVRPWGNSAGLISRLLILDTGEVRVYNENGEFFAADGFLQNGDLCALSVKRVGTTWTIYKDDVAIGTGDLGAGRIVVNQIQRHSDSAYGNGAVWGFSAIDEGVINRIYRMHDGYANNPVMEGEVGPNGNYYNMIDLIWIYTNSLDVPAIMRSL